MQKTKRVVSLLLAVMLVFTCFTCLASVTAYAADDDTDTAVVYGDVDGDGMVRINDATLLQRHLGEQEGYILEKGSKAFIAGDVDGDGEITVQDVTLIQQYLALFIDKFPVEDSTDTYIVAGAPADIFGTAWDAANEDNAMAKADDGTFTKDYTVDKAFDAVQLKTVKNGAEWIGDKTGNNVTFNLTGAGSFTVVYDPEENYTYVTGDIVEEITTFEYEAVYAAGNGEGKWLNGMAWSPDAAANKMTEVAEDVWEIKFEDVPDGFERQIKFTIDGAWTHNFGGAFVESGEETDAAYNGDNITFDTEDICTITARLDLRNFDFATKEGAKFTITVDYGE